MPNDPSSPHTVRAFLLAPLAAPVAYLIGVLVGETVVRGAPPAAGASLTLAAAVFALGTPTAYAVALAVGVPMYFVLRALRLLRRWAVWLTAAAGGGAVSFLLAPHLRGDLLSIPFPWWVGTLLGLASAEAFWRIRQR